MIRSLAGVVYIDMDRYVISLCLLLALTLGGCAVQPEKEMQTVANVDLERFMGQWYVLANIPTPFDRDVVNPLEYYELNDNGSVATTFSFRKQNGELKKYTMTGYPRELPDNGIWGMQVIWPIRADYRIVYLDEHYEYAVIGRNKRDYLWLMSRTAYVDEQRFQALVDLAVDLGYERDAIVRTNWQPETQANIEGNGEAESEGRLSPQTEIDSESEHNPMRKAG